MPREHGHIARGVRALMRQWERLWSAVPSLPEFDLFSPRGLEHEQGNRPFFT